MINERILEIAKLSAFLLLLIDNCLRKSNTFSQRSTQGLSDAHLSFLPRCQGSTVAGPRFRGPRAWGLPPAPAFCQPHDLKQVLKVL